MSDRRVAAGDEGQRLERVSLRDQAREAIRAQIVLGQLEAGKVESVINVAQRLGVSITPVREAVMDLANLGMVEVIRNRGFRVPELTSHDLDEIYHLRTLLEVPAMTEVAEVLDEASVAEFRTLAQQITDTARPGDLSTFLDLDRRFHLGLIELLGNRRLVTMVSQLRDQARMEGMQRLADQGDLTQSVEEHTAIIDALAAGDGDLAAELMRKHLAHSRGIWAGRPETE